MRVIFFYIIICKYESNLFLYYTFVHKYLYIYIFTIHVNKKCLDEFKKVWMTNITY